jgi:predicted short-subunit dehydrogenase-like oxidoreductase (DUF2520 family)
MGRVPQDRKDFFSSDAIFLLIGSGRLARHLAYFFKHLDIPLSFWSRNNDPDFNSLNPSDGTPQQRLRKLAKAASHIWILTNDGSISEMSELCADSRGILLHCSGSLNLNGVYGAHPLMSFGWNLYPHTTYLKIPFVLDSKTPNLAEIWPGLTNPQIRLEQDQKPLYHALCVASGNFSTLLWQMAKEDFSSLGISWSHLQPYLNQIFLNLSHSPDEALTGPLTRSDSLTIEKNLQALNGHDLGDIYSLFWKIYQKRRMKCPYPIL